MLQVHIPDRHWLDACNEVWTCVRCFNNIHLILHRLTLPAICFMLITPALSSQFRINKSTSRNSSLTDFRSYYSIILRKLIVDIWDVLAGLEALQLQTFSIHIFLSASCWYWLYKLDPIHHSIIPDFWCPIMWEMTQDTDWTCESKFK